MKFILHVADRRSGKESQWEVEAPSEAEALANARKAGYVVSNISIASSAPSSDASPKSGFWAGLQQGLEAGKKKQALSKAEKQKAQAESELARMRAKGLDLRAVVQVIDTRGVKIELYTDRIRIARRGVFGIGSTEKEIVLSAITSVQFKKSGFLTMGYIEFVYAGGQQWKGRGKGKFDENTVRFMHPLLSQFETLRDAIERLRTGQSVPVVSKSAPTYLDELEQLAALRDRGVITRDEFETKKKQILS